MFRSFANTIHESTKTSIWIAWYWHKCSFQLPKTFSLPTHLTKINYDIFYLTGPPDKRLSYPPMMRATVGRSPWPKTNRGQKKTSSRMDVWAIFIPAVVNSWLCRLGLPLSWELSKFIANSFSFAVSLFRTGQRIHMLLFQIVNWIDKAVCAQ